MTSHPDSVLEGKSQSEEEHIEHVAIAVQQDDRVTSKWEAVKGNPKTLVWILWAIFVLCLQGFDNQAGSQVVGIEQFRKDFGSEYDGNYVLPANWVCPSPYSPPTDEVLTFSEQSAFSGGPQATAVFGALFASWIGDSMSIIFHLDLPCGVFSNLLLNSHWSEMDHLHFLVPLVRRCCA